jgi:hypothetical protein
MKKELQEKLFTKYPKIFVQKDLPKDQTCMCWGICCDDGWYWLIDMLCGCIQSYFDNNKKHLKISQVEAEQVKQKMGGLRFYINECDDRISGFIWLAEYMSYYICENCGSTENIQPQETRGWINTICDKCWKKKNGG